MTTDSQLLDEFARTRSQPAFTTLVDRHVDMVYATALRETRDANTASDVVQATFLLLSQKAERLRGRPSVAGWLFTTARFVAADVRKRDARRRKHEQRAAMDRKETSFAESGERDWEQIAPVVNDAVAALPKMDRETVLLRFFEKRTHLEIAVVLGVSEDAAKMRLSRAIARLRTTLSHAGVQLPVASLPATLIKGLVAAPSGVGAASAVIATGKTTAEVAGLAKLVTKALIMKQAKIAALILVALFIGTTVAGVAAIKNKAARTATKPTPSSPVAATPLAGTDFTLSRWSAVVGAATGEQILKAATPTPSGLKTYTSATVATEKLTALMRPPLDAGTVLHLSPRLERGRWVTAGGGAVYINTRTASYSAAESVAGGEPAFEQTRAGGVRMTLAARLSLFGPSLVNFEDEFSLTTPAVDGTSICFVSPAFDVDGRSVRHLVVFDTIDNTSPTAARLASATDPLQWLDATPTAPRPFIPIPADFSKTTDGPQDNPTVGATLLDIRVAQQGNHAGSVQYRVSFRLDNVPVESAAEVLPAFLLCDPAAPNAVTNFDQNASPTRPTARGTAGFYLPYFYKSVTMRLGVGYRKWQTLGQCMPADVNKVFYISSNHNMPDAPTVAFSKLEPTEYYSTGRLEDPKSPGTTITAVSRHVGVRYNVAVFATDADGRDIRRVSYQFGGGSEKDEITFATTFAAPPERIKSIRFVAQPIEWVEFKDVPLPRATPKKRDEPKPLPAKVAQVDKPEPAVANPATIPATSSADSPEAAMALAREAMEKGDLRAMAACYYTTTPLERSLADLMSESAAAHLELSRAITTAYGAKAAEQVHMSTNQEPPTIRYEIKGDIATPIETATVRVAGPSQLRRADGRWKLDLTVLDLNDPQKRDQADQWLTEGKLDVTAKRKLTTEIRAGKYETASDAMEALDEIREQLQKTTTTQPTTSPTD